MESPVTPTTTFQVDALLRGGPRSLPDELRRTRVDETVDKIKIPYCAGYEHFERDGSAEEEGNVVFTWTGRTYIAE
ncbi:DUF5988 family protein [Solwaraspora sp. WMMB335]|uniref:DUF5988 family protein n=1 Tax=Solwaraspora sp. WMMB335 TaxID=3404118 RepID=UPI003B925D36